MTWALYGAPEPAGKLRHIVGNFYAPMAKLLLTVMADRGTDTEIETVGTIQDFPQLCHDLWMAPDMGTMVVNQMAKDGLLELRVVTKDPQQKCEYHDGLLVRVGYVIRHAA
jgi:hypothetical protein